MDKRVIFAVAGAGKTTHIISALSLEKRALIVTYTENNYHHLRNKVIQKFGFIPENITVLTYFTFLYSFCYKPFLHQRYGAKGINWDVPPAFTLRLPRANPKFYLDSSRRLYSNRIAKLVIQEQIVGYVVDRLSKYFDQFFVDEIQDFGGHDFDLLIALCRAEMDINFVGDFFQHTFDTSRDGKLHSDLYDDFGKYQAHFEKAGLTPDTQTLSHSWRCTPSVCEFITQNIGVNINSHRQDESEVRFISDEAEYIEKFNCPETVKLFYQNHKKYPCFSENWGKSKGQDHYQDVCVVLNGVASKAFKKSSLTELVSSSRNKLYVACTRANNSLFFVEEAKLKEFKAK